ncbi:MAG TPA: hypothetical protein VGA61_04405 [Anaerolineae bacterium]
MEKTLWRAVHNLCLWWPAIVTGRVLDAGSGQVSAVVEQKVTPVFSDTGTALTILLSGCAFQAEMDAAHQARWEKLGAIVPLETNIHLELERVFGVAGAEVLRFYNLWTLEDLAAGKAGSELVETATGQRERKTPLPAVLAKFLNAEDVQLKLQEVQTLLQEEK